MLASTAGRPRAQSASANSRHHAALVKPASTRTSSLGRMFLRLSVTPTEISTPTRGPMTEGAVAAELRRQLKKSSFDMSLLEQRHTHLEQR